VEGVDVEKTTRKRKKKKGALSGMVEPKAGKKKEPNPFRLLDIEKIHPNPWNPNEMPPPLFDKLVSGLKHTIEQGSLKDVPPIVVRKHPSIDGEYEIVDGEHRWRAMKSELKLPQIGAYRIKADDATARILTRTLNYLRGSPDREKYARGLVELIELGVPYEDLGELLPEDDYELDALIDEAGITLEAFTKLEEAEKAAEGEEEEDSNKIPEEPWVNLTFNVVVSQAKVIEQEIKRISKVLKGKNKRGRALEFMAAQSSTTELPDDTV